MRRRDTLIAGLVAAMAAAAPLAAPEGDAAPRIRVEPSSFDFGRVKQQRTLRKEFRLLNLGERNLVIEQISGSCACSAAALDVTSLTPGGSTPLRVSLETRDSSGEIEHQVLVRSNDPQTPLLKIQLRATVVDGAR